MSDILEDREPLRVLSGYRHEITHFRRLPSARDFLRLAAVMSGMFGFWLMAMGVFS
jgi:hypothetical protein